MSIFQMHQDWLSCHVQRAYGEIRPRSLRRRLEGCIEQIQIYLSGRAALVIVPLCTFATLALLAMPFSRVSLPWSSQWRQIVTFLNTLWQVHAGILGVTFVVVVLLIQSVSQKWEEENLFRVYVQYSSIIPIAFLGLSLVLVLGALILLVSIYKDVPPLLSGVVLASLLLFGLFVFLTAWLYWKTVQFLRPGHVRSVRQSVAERAIEKSIDAEVVRRLNRSILQRKVQEFGLRVFPLSIDTRTDLTPIRDSRRGIVKDVNIRQLAEFSQMLTTAISDGDSPVRAFLLKGVDSFVSEDGDVLARVAERDVTAETATALRKAYRIGPYQPPAEDLGDQLVNLKDQAFSAVRSARPGEFQDVLNMYARLIERILYCMKELGSLFDPRMASSPLEFEWGPVRVLRNDLYDIIRLALDTGDQEMIERAVAFPYQVMELPFCYGDHQLFRHLGNFYPAIYKLLSPRTDERTVEYVRCRCWQFLRQFLDYRITRRMERDIVDLEQLAELKGYAVGIILTFNDLLKAAIDRRDATAFREFGRGLDLLLQHFDPGRAVPDHYELEFQFESRQLDQVERTRIETRLSRYRTLEAIGNELELIRRQIWFGLAGWLTYEFLDRRLEQQEFADLFDSARTHFSDLSALGETFLQSVKRSTGADIALGWISWDMDLREEGETRGVSTEGWLMTFYCIQGLRLTPEDIGESGTPIPPDRQLDYMLDSLRETCNSIERQRDQWAGIVTPDDIDRIPKFLELNRRAKEEQLRREEDWLIAQEISPRKRTEFQNQFLEAWANGATVRAIITRYGRFEDRTHEPSPTRLDCYGFKVMDDKAAFVEGWHIGYPGWGANYGARIAQTENTITLAKLISNVPVLEISDPDLETQITESLRTLRESGYAPNVILVGWERWISQELRRSALFVPRGHPDCPSVDIQGYQGVFDGVPVFSMLRELTDHILVLDLQRLGTWVQYQVTGSPDQTFEFHIAAFDEEEAEELLTQQPERMQDGRTGRQLSRGEAIRRILQQVHLRVLERFDYVFEDMQAGLKLSIHATSGEEESPDPEETEP